MRVLILGGDGFCGWPTALHLSAAGHDVHILDDFSRRLIDVELGTVSLTPIRELSERVRAWQEISGREIGWQYADASNNGRLGDALLSIRPDAVVHFAEQRAAPYSMRSPESKRYTVNRNVAATHNLLCALVELELDAHVVHLGTMGVYGYGASDGVIPEGYLRVATVPDQRNATSTDWRYETEPLEILHPTRPGSVYHMTKCLDQTLFEFYARNDGLRITDLHQGIVWGTQTDETEQDERLVNRFDYCGDFGTVLNRFIVQAVVRHPLTVHGTGGQTRAFIHIRDTVRCVELALENPPERGERVKILNQMTECHRVRDLAEMISQATGVEVAYVPNPRNEAAENELLVANDSLLRLGLEPTTLADELLAEVWDVADRYSDRVDLSKIPARSVWTREQKPGEITQPLAAPAPRE